MGGGADVLAKRHDIRHPPRPYRRTKAEFVTGMKRLAAQIQPNGDLTFNDLVQPLKPRQGRGQQSGFGFRLGQDHARGSPPGGNRSQ